MCRCVPDCDVSCKSCGASNCLCNEKFRCSLSSNRPRYSDVASETCLSVPLKRRITWKHREATFTFETLSAHLPSNVPCCVPLQQRVVHKPLYVIKAQFDTAQFEACWWYRRLHQAEKDFCPTVRKLRAFTSNKREKIKFALHIFQSLGLKCNFCLSSSGYVRSLSYVLNLRHFLQF